MDPPTALGRALPIDQAIGFHRLVGHTLVGLGLELEPPRGFSWSPGDYAFLCIPSIAKHEWHPFTISSAEESGALKFHVRSLGNRTAALRRRVEQNEASGNEEQMAAYVDGPYGSPSAHIFDSRFAVFIGAGIGVTPFASVLASFVLRANGDRPPNLTKAHFFWLNKDQYSFEWFAALLAELEEDDGKQLLDIHLCMTAGRADTTALGVEVARSLTIAGVSLVLACDEGASGGHAPVVDRGGNCATCHMPEFERVADPVHVGHKPAKCAVCHVQDGWRPSVVHHEFSPLAGAHQKADCTYCHGKGATAVFKGTTKDCATCHQPEYDASPYPGHKAFPTTCADCHSTTAFRPATFIPLPVVAAPVVTAVLGGKTLPLLPKKGAPGSKPGTRPTAVAVTPPSPPPQATPPRAPPPTAPTIRPPPDVTSRASPRRR